MNDRRQQRLPRRTEHDLHEKQRTQELPCCHRPCLLIARPCLDRCCVYRTVCKGAHKVSYYENMHLYTNEHTEHTDQRQAFQTVNYITTAPCICLFLLDSFFVRSCPPSLSTTYVSYALVLVSYIARVITSESTSTISKRQLAAAGVAPNAATQQCKQSVLSARPPARLLHKCASTYCIIRKVSPPCFELPAKLSVLCTTYLVMC